MGEVLVLAGGADVSQGLVELGMDMGGSPAESAMADEHHPVVPRRLDLRPSFVVGLAGNGRHREVGTGGDVGKREHAAKLRLGSDISGRRKDLQDAIGVCSSGFSMTDIQHQRSCDMPALAELTTIVIDCADPGSLAEFYRAVTGWKVTYQDEDSVQLGGGGPIQLGFQRIVGYRPPGWPDPAKHAHLDLTVSDLDHAVEELLAIGATKPEFQPGGDGWVVLVDPEGHPFCLVLSD